MTATQDTPHAPGCFGSSICFQAASPECGACMFKTQCEPLAVARGIELRARFGVKERAIKPKAIPAAGEPSEHVAERTLPKKVEELLQRIANAGITVTDSLARGENPFTSKPTFLRIACHLLLRRQGGFTRPELVRGLMTKLNWTEGTASAHATQAFQALKALGAAEESNGFLTLKGNAHDAR